MVSDHDAVGPAWDCRVGGPSASRYFLMVALWIPNSRSIARRDIPHAPSFLNGFPSLPLKERRLARRGGIDHRSDRPHAATAPQRAIPVRCGARAFGVSRQTAWRAEQPE